MITLPANDTMPLAENFSGDLNTPAAPTTFWRRVGAGTFGGGMLGVLGLLSGFMVPTATLVIRVSRGPVNHDPAGSILSILPEALELLFALFLGFVQGAVGLVVGLIVGVVVSSVGPLDGRPRRILLATALLGVAALVCAIQFALTATSPAHTP